MQWGNEQLLHLCLFSGISILFESRVLGWGGGEVHSTFLPLFFSPTELNLLLPLSHFLLPFLSFLLRDCAAIVGVLSVELSSLRAWWVDQYRQWKYSLYHQWLLVWAFIPKSNWHRNSNSNNAHCMQTVCGICKYFEALGQFSPFYFKTDILVSKYRMFFSVIS